MPTPIEILFTTNVADAMKAFGSVEASLQKLSRAGQSAAERSSRSRIKAENDVAKATDKSAKDAAKAIERSAKEAAKAQERASNEALRIRERNNALEIRLYQQGEREKTRALESAERERTRAAERAVKERQHAEERARRESESRARAMGKIAGSTANRVMGMAGRAAAVVGTLGAGFGLADALQAGIRQEKDAGIIFRGAAEKGDFKSAKEVGDFARQTAIKTGGTTDDVNAGLLSFVGKTGDLGAAKEMLEDMAKLSAATGANFEDMGLTTAQVFNQLNDSKQTMEVMRALVGQGQAGAIDIRDLGQYGGRLASSAAQYGGSLSSNIESFGAIAQLANKLGGADTPAEATESVARLGSDVEQHAAGFQQLLGGHGAFTDKSHTKLKNAEDLITESVVNTRGDLVKLKELFGERSIRAVTGAQVVYANAGGGEAGEKAIRAMFASLKAHTPSQEAIDQGAKDAAATTAAKLNTAMEQLHKAINERLLPLLPSLIDKFVQLIPPLEHFLDWALSLSKLEGLGALIGGAIAVEIGKASIANVIEGSVAKLFGGKAAAGALGSGAGGIAVGALAVGAAGVLGTRAVWEDRHEADAAVRATDFSVGNDTALFRKGKLSPAKQVQNIERLQQLIASGEGAKAGMDADPSGIVRMVGHLYDAGVNYTTAGESGKTFHSANEAEAAAKQLDSLKEQLRDANEALKEMAANARAIANVEIPAAGGMSDPDHQGRGGVQ